MPLTLAVFAVRGFELAANWQSMSAAFQGPAFGRPPSGARGGLYGAIEVNSPGTALLAGAEASAFLALGAWLVPRTIAAHARTVFTPGTELELVGRVQRLTESRSHALDTATSELRRIERDLHDGAQARLVALGMNLRAVEKVLPVNPQAALALVAEARESSGRALNELRDLIRGICPPVLADRGLGHAVRALALDTPLPTELDIDLPGRLSAPVESACYFAVAEALANAVKHSGARRVQIHIKHADNVLRIEVADDGVGGADPAAGNRAARRGAAAGHLRWDPGRKQPAWRADHDRHGGAVRVVVAEDLFLLRDGLTRLLTAHDFEIAAAVDNAPGLLSALLEQRPDVAIVDVRLPPAFADDGLQAALTARREVPGLPVVLLSQYVEQLYARRTARRPGGRGRLPAQGPGVQRRPVRRRDPHRGRWRHGDGPRGGDQAARPPGQGRAGQPAAPRGSARSWR